MNYFFALPLGKLAKRIEKDLIVPLQSTDSREQLRWSHPQNLHITLGYLGALDQKAMTKAVACAERLQGSPFLCSIGRLEYFPDAKSRILALHVKAEQPLVDLQKQLLSHLKREGVPCDDRPYRPHITIARLRHRQTIEHWQLPEYSASLAVSSVVLYGSEVSEAGAGRPLYQKIAEFALKAAQ